MASVKQRRPGRGRRVLIGVVIVLALLWCGAWFGARYVAGVGIEKAVAALSARGFAVSCSVGGIGGFPLTLDLNCQDGKATAVGQLNGSLNGVTAKAFLYRPGHVTASLAGPLSADLPTIGSGLKASWTTASGEANVGLNGLDSLSGALDDFALQLTGTAPQLPFRQVSAKTARISAGPSGVEDYRIAGLLRDIAIERVEGGAFPVLGAEGAVVALKFGSSLGTDLNTRLAEWVAKGGALKVEGLAFSVGDVSARAFGDLVLGTDGLLSGKLQVRIVGLEKLADLADQLKPGSRDKVANVVKAIGAFTKPSADGSGARELTLNIRSGLVLAGMFPLFPDTIPPIRF